MWWRAIARHRANVAGPAPAVDVGVVGVELVDFGRIAEIYQVVYGDADACRTYDYVRRVGTVSEASPYIFQCPQLAQR